MANLLTNGDFEGAFVSGIAPNWTRIAALPASIAAGQETTHPLFSLSAQRFILTNTPNGVSGGIYQVVTLPLSGGVVLRAQPYCVSLFALVDADFSQWYRWHAAVKWYDNSATLLQTDTAQWSVDFFNTPGSDATWNRYSLFVTCPSGAVTARVEIVAENTSGLSPTATGIVLFDGAQFEYCDLYATNISIPPFVPVPVEPPGWSTMQAHGYTNGFGDVLPDGWNYSQYGGGAYTVERVTNPALHGSATEIAVTSSSPLSAIVIGDDRARADYVIGGSTAGSYIPDLVADPNHYAYVVTVKYWVTHAIDATMQAALRVELEGGNDLSDGGGTVPDTTGPLGEGVSTAWQTLTATFGAGTAHLTTGWATTPTGIRLHVGIADPGANGAKLGTIVIGEVKIALGTNTSPPAQTYAAAGYYPSPFVPNPGVVIGGTLVQAIAGTLSARQEIGQRGQGSVSVWTALGVHWSYGTRIVITAPGPITLYNGYVTKDKISKSGARLGQGLLQHDLTLMDNAYRADKRLITASYLNEMAGDIVINIVATTLAAEGVSTASGSVAAGVELPAVSWVLKNVAEALDWLAEQCGYWWSIDMQGVLWFQPYGGLPATSSLDGTTISADDNLSVAWGNDKYVNRQYVKGGYTTTSERTEFLPGDGHKRAFTLQYEVATIKTIYENSILKSFGTKGIDSGFDWYAATGDAVLAQDDHGTVLGVTDTLVVTYKGRYPVVGLATNPALIAAQSDLEGGGTGYVESAHDERQVYELSMATQIATAMLNKYGADMVVLDYYTTSTALQPGQSVSVTLADFGLSNKTMLVTAVEITDGVDGYTLWYHVTAVGSPYSAAQWQDFYKRSLDQGTDWAAIGTIQTVLVSVGTLEGNSVLAVTARVVVPAGGAPLIGNGVLT